MKPTWTSKGESEIKDFIESLGFCVNKSKNRKLLDGKEIDKIEISTHHFKGNFPSYCSLQAAYLPTIKGSKQIVNSSVKWKYLLKDAKLSSNKLHIFKNNLMKKDKINFIKINIFPDGGISRFRIYGKNV